jgi:hypothetical protein
MAKYRGDWDACPSGQKMIRKPRTRKGGGKPKRK